MKTTLNAILYLIALVAFITLSCVYVGAGETYDFGAVMGEGGFSAPEPRQPDYIDRVNEQREYLENERQWQELQEPRNAKVRALWQMEQESIKPSGQRMLIPGYGWVK